MLPATISANHVECLQLPDVLRLERMPSLPAWVALRIGSLKLAVQPDQSGKWREVFTLPASLILRVAERDEITRHASELRALCAQTPANDQKAEENTLVAVTKMMMVLPSTAQNEFSAEARGEAFMAALEDLPAWAVQAAIRRWYRGDCGQNDKGQPYDYHWCPAPAELRQISQREMYRLKGRAEDLEKLLRAEPLIEFSDEHRHEMQRRLLAILPSLRNPPVGKDGSGGVVGIEPIDGAHCGTQPKHSPA